MVLNDLPLTQDLVLVGGGHAHALVLRSWGMNPLPGARVTVVNPGPTAPYTGMLPGHVAGHYGRDDLEIDLVRLCRFAGARLILDKAVGIDRAARQVHLAGRAPVGYDVASIDVGITAEMALPGFEDHAIGAKPLDRYAAHWREYLERITPGQEAEVAVIGGGVAGVELAMAMAYALRERGARPKVTVIEAGAQISGMGERARQRVRRAMAALDVDLRPNARVVRIEKAQVVLDGQDPVPATLCVGSAGAFPHGWIAKTDLPLHNGFIKVSADLGVPGDPHLFAVGDCAHMTDTPRPKAGVFAVRAAPVLHHNLRAALRGGERKPFRPQKHYLKLISLGGQSAMAEKFGFTVSGPFLWRWKDRIDRSFMQRLGDLPLMPPAAAPSEVASGVAAIVKGAPLCGGCGAKVGGGVLRKALADLPQAGGDVVTAAGDDAAVLRQPGGGFQVISTDHLRGFVADPAVMARIAAVHALGDVWSMGATPQVALSSIVLPRMSEALQARSLQEITHAAQDVLAPAGARLVGGHTTMGAELTIGFTVTGTRQDPPITHAGAQSGDHLILTRPIGSGVILSGEMQGHAKGPEVAGLLAIMSREQGQAAQVLQGAHAMTDVTGFGLAGHLAAICRASAMDGILWADKIPYYPGAQRLSALGVASTLMPSNRADAPVMGAEEPLLFDPQTAGGLLAAVAPDQSQGLVASLRAVGAQAAIIGQLEAGTGRLHLQS